MIFILDRINVNGEGAQSAPRGTRGVPFAAKMGFNTVALARGADGGAAGEAAVAYQLRMSGKVRFPVMLAT